ncbi:MAG TPA: hypothetical protein VFZ79_20425 [Acidimicrobiales bacterium]
MRRKPSGPTRLDRPRPAQQHAARHAEHRQQRDQHGVEDGHQQRDGEDHEEEHDGGHGGQGHQVVDQVGAAPGDRAATAGERWYPEAGGRPCQSRATVSTRRSISPAVVV